MHATLALLRSSDFPRIARQALDTLQVNLGYRCNQACLHCHVNASPDRKEMMDRATVDQVLAVLAARRIATLDVTGGAPELNPHFRHLVHSARADLCRRLGRMAEARASYERALVLTRQEPERRFLERRLGELGAG